MDLTAIQKAVYAHLSANAAIVALSAAVYDTIAPQNAAMPYIVLTIIDDVRQFNANVDLERVRLQVDVYHAQDVERGVRGSAATAHSVAAAVETALRGQWMNDATGVYWPVQAVPEGTRKTLEDDTVWRLSSDYLLVFEPILRR